MLGGVVGVGIGVAVAVFLMGLDFVTRLRLVEPRLIFALPLFGAALGALYDRVGREASRGMSVIFEALGEPPRPRDGEHESEDRETSRATPHVARVPGVMGILVLVGTWLTHLGGGSAGREGTAVQLGASMASSLARRLRLTEELQRRLIVAGIAGGFGAVFGTPIAGVAFACEVRRVGRPRFEGLGGAVLAAWVGDQVCAALGVVHTGFPLVHAPIDPQVALLWPTLGLALGLALIVYIELVERLKRLTTTHLRSRAVRLAVGGVIIAALAASDRWATALDPHAHVGPILDALGLGVPTILRAFVDPTLPLWSWAVKLVLTALTLGFGFVGGEVTPLFFVGATLGSVVARVLGLPLEVGAAAGMAAAFGAAANTPIALSIMAVELFGFDIAPHALAVSYIAWLVVGRRSIYEQQPGLAEKVSIVEWFGRSTAEPKLRPPSHKSGAPVDDD